MRTTRVEIRNDSVLVDGYVNAVERESNPVVCERGKCIEKVKAGTFAKAIERADKIECLLDHNKDKVLASTEDSSLEVFEDNIGLRAIATISDAETVQKAKEGKLKGWSFGMYVNDDDFEERADGELPLRTLNDIDMFEVSIIDEKMNPCYSATSIETRADGDDKTMEHRAIESKVVTENMVETPEEPINYSDYEKRITAIKKSAN